MSANDESIVCNGYRNEMDGSATVWFTINGQRYAYQMDRDQAETCDWLSRKSQGKALSYAKKHAWKWRKAVKVQEELTKIAWELVAEVKGPNGFPVIATNESSFSWEDDARYRNAYLELEPSGDLYLTVIEKVIKMGLGAGTRSATLWEGTVGNLGKPRLGEIVRVLAKFSMERSRSSAPFKRLWRNAKGDLQALTEIIGEYAAALNSPAIPKLDSRKLLMEAVSLLSDADVDGLLAGDQNAINALRRLIKIKTGA